VKRAAALATLLTLGVAAGSPGTWVASAVDLPSVVRSAAAAAGRVAGDAPERRLQAARLTGQPQNDVPRVEAGLDGAWTVDGAGRHGARASARGTLRWIDPSRTREVGETRLQLRAARVDALLAREEAATSAVRTWILAWRAEQRIRLARRARALPPPVDPELRAEHERLLSDAPLLDLAAARLGRELERLTGRTPGAALPLAAWDRFALRPVDVCPDGDVGLVLARRAARDARQRAELHALAAARPSVSVSLSADVGVPDVAEPHVDVGARIALSVGAPARWPVAGRLHAEADPSGTTVSIEARHEPRSTPRRWDLEVAAADATATEARHRSVERTRLDHARWRRAAERLHELGPPAGPPATFDELRAAWERLDLVAHAADLQSRLALSCAIEEVLEPPVVP
jgi:hypothetical protein